MGFATVVAALCAPGAPGAVTRKGVDMDPQSTNLELNETTRVSPTLTSPAAPPQPEKGAIGIAFVVWLFGGGLGLAVLIFVLLKVF
jgi:hypothetical protein